MNESRLRETRDVTIKGREKDGEGEGKEGRGDREK